MVKSAGPRSARGKARSSLNAAKHWIASGRILESEQKEAALLRDGFVEDFTPKSQAEYEVIEDVVFNRLIRRRVDMAFTREFSKAIVGRLLSRTENDERTAIAFRLRSNPLRERQPGEMDARLCPNRCIGALKGLSQRIIEHGPQPVQDLWSLSRIYGEEPTEYGATLMDRLTQIVQVDELETKDQPTTVNQEELKGWLLKYIGFEIQRQNMQLEVADRLEALEIASIQEPAPPTLEMLLRYRAANTREFENLLKILEHIRSLRGSAS